ncbi:MAG: 3-oxoacyl-[acyl-carrier-protein] reductase, partial [Elusimicrobiota bacterium]
MCEKKLEGSVAIVTGGAQGIGRAIAEALAAEGAKIIISDIDENLANQSAEEISKTSGVETLSIKADVCLAQDAENLINRTIEKFQKIDILVNNAGITKDNLLIRMSEQEWDAVLNINLKGVFNCTKAASKVMMKQRSGRIINISSVVALMGNPGQVNYSASKSGVIGFTKSCAKELASRGILVNAVAPGFIKTRMTDKLNEEQKKKLTELIPLNRLGEPQDIAGVVVFLCSK